MQQWLQEDIPTFDYSPLLLGKEAENCATGYIVFKSLNGILAGTNVVDALASEVGLFTKWKCSEGCTLQNGQVIGEITGKLGDLLVVERISLNVLTRLTGIATKCSKLRKLAGNCGYSGVLAGTRKTTPGFMMLEKYAMTVGGFQTHRMNASESPTIIKDNHWSAKEGLFSTLDRKSLPFHNKIEVECNSLEMALEVADWGADILMLDNFSPKDAKEATEAIKERFPRVLVEVSGGIDEENIELYASIPNVDVISCGAVTQKACYADFSMRISSD